MGLGGPEGMPALSRGLFLAPWERVLSWDMFLLLVNPGHDQGEVHFSLGVPEDLSFLCSALPARREREEARRSRAPAAAALPTQQAKSCFCVSLPFLVGETPVAAPAPSPQAPLCPCQHQPLAWKEEHSLTPSPGWASTLCTDEFQRLEHRGLRERSVEEQDTNRNSHSSLKWLL